MPKRIIPWTVGYTLLHGAISFGSIRRFQSEACHGAETKGVGVWSDARDKVDIDVDHGSKSAHGDPLDGTGDIPSEALGAWIVSGWNPAVVGYG